MIDQVAIEETEFEAFFRATEPVLSRALAAGFGFDLGRDATAEALAYGWQNWQKITAMTNPAGYLFRVAERWAIRQRRRDGPEIFAAAHSVDPSRFEPGLGPALSRLSRRQRQVVVLVAGYGMSHFEAATFLGVSRTSVQNHYERGIAKLRTALGADCDR